MRTFLTLSTLSSDEAQRAWTRSVGGTDELDPLARACALTRSMLWALTRSSPLAHVHRILSLAVDLVAGDGRSDERTARDQIRRALDELADAGDAVDTGGGWWSPAATREVELQPGEAGRLLVGGLPTAALPPGLQGCITHHGAFRHVRDARLRDELTLPTESLESWTRTPRVPLAEWASELLDAPLSKYVESHDGGRFRFYAPGQPGAGGTQFTRWLERPTVSGRFLAERTRIFGAREYRVAEIRASRIEGCGATLLPGEHRRLMYALDERAGASVEAKVSAAGGELTLVLKSELPRAEQRLFAALGRLEQEEGRYYPRTWRFDASHRDLVEARLRGLGLLVNPEARRGRT